MFFEARRLLIKYFVPYVAKTTSVAENAMSKILRGKKLRISDLNFSQADFRLFLGNFFDRSFIDLLTSLRKGLRCFNLRQKAAALPKLPVS